MKLDFVDVERFVKYLYDKDIDANEFIICYLLYKKDEGLIKEFKDKINFNSLGIGKVDEVTRKYIDSLVSKGYLEDFNPTENGKKYYKIDNFFVTNKFSMVITADREKIAKELWDVYPLFIFIKDKNKKVHAKTIAYEELPDVYGKAIDDDLVLHDKIIKKLKAYKRKNQYINIGLQKFIERRYWESLDEAGDGGSDDNTDQFEGGDMINSI